MAKLLFGNVCVLQLFCPVLGLRDMLFSAPATPSKHLPDFCQTFELGDSESIRDS